MGVVIWKSKPNSVQGEQHVLLTPKKQIAFAVSVSLLNPHAILDTIGVIGTSSLKYDGIDKTAFAAACIITSWLCFLD